jgi:hypothetical protein
MVKLLGIVILIGLGSVYSKSCGFAYHAAIGIGQCTEGLNLLGCTYDGSEVVLTYRNQTFGVGCSTGARNGTEEQSARITLSRPCDSVMPAGPMHYARPWGLQCRPILPEREKPAGTVERCLAVVPSTKEFSRSGDQRVVCGCAATWTHSAWENEDGEETIGSVNIGIPIRRDYRATWSYIPLAVLVPLAVVVDTITSPIQVYLVFHLEIDK